MLTTAARGLALQTVTDARGDLVVAEHLPFPIIETVWTAAPDDCAALSVDRPALLIALAGHLMVVVDDGPGPSSFVLDSPTRGLLVAAGHPRSVHRMNGDCLCLLLAGPQP